ncbi:unnamed protein product [Leptosia nina]|uniref:SH3 domain-containing protein n=1 Tax=Leptosia nina TaxID=320188 RepID=A0AAV1J9N1_9NEOP
MDLFRQGMKGPSRPAPLPPGVVHRYSPVTNWNDDPFASEVFEPSPLHAQKKKPPPRPPPPKVNRQPEVSAKPSHFIRKPTVLTSLLNRKNKNTVQQAVNQPTPDFNEVDNSKLFPRCDRASIQTATLIDFSSPPSSPTFTTRSSSDGISVDSFGSDATTSTNNRNAIGGGNASQAESGFEDDFDLFLTSRKPISKEDTLDDFSAIDPFSPPPVNKPPIMKKPVISKDPFETMTSQSSVPPLKGPTIIRAKPARPKPPDNSALLKSTFGSSFQMATMNINTTTPIQKINNGLMSDDVKHLSWDREESPEREKTPPMPSIPPPPPPIVDEDLPVVWPEDLPDFDEVPNSHSDEDEPHAIALFDYFTDHSEDLYFSAGSKIILVRRVNDEWMYGKLKSGAEGVFPSNFVEVKVPLPSDGNTSLGTALALYDFSPVQDGDLGFNAGDNITVLSKINEEWYFGECNGLKGQFPVNYVQIS